jgi:putative aminopeptidase FrvX
VCWEVGPRPAGSAAERQAAAYLARELADFGYIVAVQRGIKLGNAGQSTAKVFGLAPGAGRKPRIVVGAHYDTVSPAVQGANDNASGVAVVLELARLLVRQPLPYAIQIVFFGAEERSPGGDSLVGSRYFARRSAGSAVAMVNVDMVGCGTSLHVWQCGARSRYLAGLVARSAAALGLSVAASGQPYVLCLQGSQRVQEEPTRPSISRCGRWNAQVGSSCTR